MPSAYWSVLSPGFMPAWINAHHGYFRWHISCQTNNHKHLFEHFEYYFLDQAADQNT